MTEELLPHHTGAGQMLHQHRRPRGGSGASHTAAGAPQQVKFGSPFLPMHVATLCQIITPQIIDQIESSELDDPKRTNIKYELLEMNKEVNTKS